MDCKLTIQKNHPKNMHFQVTHGVKKKRTEARWCQGGPKRVQHARQMNAIGLTESYGQDRGGHQSIFVWKMNGERKLQPSPIEKTGK